MTGSGELGVCVRASYYSDQGYVTVLRRKVLSDAGSGKKSSWNKKEKDSDFVFLNVSFESIWKNCSLTVFPPLAWILPGFMNISSVRSPLNHSYQELFDSWRSYLWVGEDENKKEVVPVQNENDWLSTAGSWEENVSVTLQQIAVIFKGRRRPHRALSVSVIVLGVNLTELCVFQPSCMSRGWLMGRWWRVNKQLVVHLQCLVCIKKQRWLWHHPFSTTCTSFYIIVEAGWAG